MRKNVATLTLLALMLCARAQASETARHALLGRMFTTGDYWGFPAESGDPFPCNGAVERSTYYNTTSHLPKMCDGTSWVSVGGLTSPVSGDYVWTGKATFGSAADAAGSVRLGETASCVVFEGATADAFETSACAADPTADTTINFPAFSAGTYTLATLTGTETLSGKTLTTPTIGSFTNATHDHTNAAGGGTLNAGTALGAGQVALARGGTNADLSATGGTSQFLKQASSGAAITVVRPACADLSNAATSCSTDTTNAANIASGTLATARGGFGQSMSGLIIPMTVKTVSDNSIFTFATISVANNTDIGGELSFCAESRDATHSVLRCQKQNFGCTALTGGTAGGPSAALGATSPVSGGGSNTVTFTIVNNANSCDLRMTIVASGFTPSVSTFVYTIVVNTAYSNTVTPQ